MAWLNYAWAKQEGGEFILRFDDLAPAYAGEDTSRQDVFAEDGARLLASAGIVPDRVTRLSEHHRKDFPEHAGGNNFWLRGPALEGCDNVGCSPALVASRVAADIAEGVTHVIRGEELTIELHLYEYLNSIFNGGPRRIMYLPRLRVCVNGELSTISKTYGNLQLRDLFAERSPLEWVEVVRQVCLIDPNRPIGLDNIHCDPVIDVGCRS